MHPRADIISAVAANEAFRLACAAANQPVQHTKTTAVADEVLFDGLLLRFTTKEIGYPVSKQLPLLFKLGHALGHSYNHTITRIPPA